MNHNMNYGSSPGYYNQGQQHQQHQQQQQPGQQYYGGESGGYNCDPHGYQGGGGGGGNGSPYHQQQPYQGTAGYNHYNNQMPHPAFLQQQYGPGGGGIMPMRQLSPGNGGINSRHPLAPPMGPIKDDLNKHQPNMSYGFGGGGGGGYGFNNGYDGGGMFPTPPANLRHPNSFDDFYKKEELDSDGDHPVQKRLKTDPNCALSNNNFHPESGEGGGCLSDKDRNRDTTDSSSVKTKEEPNVNPGEAASNSRDDGDNSEQSRTNATGDPGGGEKDVKRESNSEEQQQQRKGGGNLMDSLESIPELPEIPELKFGDDGNNGGGNNGNGGGGGGADGGGGGGGSPPNEHQQRQGGDNNAMPCGMSPQEQQEMMQHQMGKKGLVYRITGKVAHGIFFKQGQSGGVGVGGDGVVAYCLQRAVWNRRSRLERPPPQPLDYFANRGPNN